MTSIVTACCGIPGWMERSLLKESQFGDEDDVMPDYHSEQEAVMEEVSAIPSTKIKAYYEEMSKQLVNPDEWGKKGKRLIGVSQAVRSRVSKKIYDVTKGYHKAIPVDGIFEALSNEGLVPIQEDGYRWSGLLLGTAECGTEDARKQVANFEIATVDANGKWGMANMWLHLAWCRMSPSGNYEIVCYLS